MGAFGAHGLKALLEPERLVSFETGVRYQFYHGLALLLAGILSRDFKSRIFNLAGTLFIAGVIFFSGSIYLLACREILGIQSWTWLGPVTPLGGIFLLTGWMLLFVSFLKSGNS